VLEPVGDRTELAALLGDLGDRGRDGIAVGDVDRRP
jgi:hypothetical protein